MHPENAQPGAVDRFAIVRNAILALHNAESSSGLRAATWWPGLISALEDTRRACQTLNLSLLATLSLRVLETLRPLRDGVVDLGPTTLQLLARALGKWIEIQEELSNLRADSEVTTLLRSLGEEDDDSASKSPTGHATTHIADMSQYLPLFVDETEEGLETMQTHLLELERGVKVTGFLPPQAIIDELFRHAHKIKASSAAMGFSALAELTHTMENVLDQLRGGKLMITPDLVSSLLTALDQVRHEVDTAKSGKIPTNDLLGVRASLLWYLDSVPATENTERPSVTPETTQLISVSSAAIAEGDIEKIGLAIEQGQFAYRVSIQVREQSSSPEMRLFLAINRLRPIGTIVSSTTPLDDIENQAGLRSLSLLVVTKEAQEQLYHALRDDEIASLKVELAKDPAAAAETIAAPQATQPGVQQSIRVPIARLDELMNLSGELSISKNSFLSVSQHLQTYVAETRAANRKGERLSLSLDESIQQLSQLASGIQQIVLELRMVPISPLFERCRRIVRDISHELGKEVELILRGSDTSLDKKIIDQLGDPLNHMVRNALDHGLETPADREAAGKPARGTIILEAQREGSRICVTISDDGRGLSPDDIRRKAVALGLVSQEVAAAMSQTELVPFIFHAGFSTARSVTNISGRGVGLDIVQKRIEEINGSIEVDSVPGRGTQFRISLPLTIVSQTSLLFNIHGVTFAFALHNVAEILRIKAAELSEMGFGKFLRLREEMIPVFRIKHFFRNTHFVVQKEEPEVLNVVIVRAGKRRIGLIVDQLEGEEEILVKHPGNLVGEIPGIAGVSVLSSGTIALILDVDKLIDKTAAEKTDNAQTEPAAA